MQPVGLVKHVQRRVVSEEVLAGTEIPGGGGSESSSFYIFNLYFIYIFNFTPSQPVGLYQGEGRGRLYLTVHCHHHNDSCIKMGSNESRFNVSVIVL